VHRWSNSYLLSPNCIIPSRLPIAVQNYCARCAICPDDVFGFALGSRHPHFQQYLHLSTMAAEEVGLWQFADCPNLADAHRGLYI